MSVTTAKNWIDVSVPLTNGMAHWPGDPEPNFQRISDMDQGSEANVTFCRMTAHTGTHVDAPCHFLAGRDGIETFPLTAGIGRARLISVGHAAVIGAAELAGKNLQAGERILLRTRDSDRRWDNQEFQPDYCAIHPSAAEVLARAGVVLIGVDYLSVGAYDETCGDTHRILLSAGIWIVEGLRLAHLVDGTYDMICLPINIQGSDGAPARVVLRQVEY